MAPKRKKSDSAAASASAADAPASPAADTTASPAADTPDAAASSSSAHRRSPRLAKVAAAAAAAAADPPAADQEPPKKKKKKTKTAASESTSAATDEDSEADNDPKTVIIEHCTQCNSFKSRATRVKNKLKKEIAGVKVVINPENQKGCYEIREEGEDVVVSLLNVEKLDMAALMADIAQRIR